MSQENFEVVDARCRTNSRSRLEDKGPPNLPQIIFNTDNQKNDLQQSKAILPLHQINSESTLISNSGRPSVVGQHFRVGKKIGEGSFGTIYEGLNVVENHAVAIKFESRKSEAPQLRDEYKSYKILAGTEGIPRVFYYGQEGNYNCLVMELLGHSLEYLFDCCSRRFSIQTAALLAIQMISRVQSIHDHSLIYRDIKPDNFLVGRKDKAHVIYIVDFGMAKHYRDPRTKVHIPYRERKSLSGTARYMSINTHLGREQSRRDDLEAVGNVLMYFSRGSLPWQGLKAPTNKLKYEKIGEKKQQVSVLELCQGFPEEFSAYIYYVRKLGFEDTPDYGYLKGLFIDLASRLEVHNPFIFDWTQTVSVGSTAVDVSATAGYSASLGILSVNGQVIRRLSPGGKDINSSELEYQSLATGDSFGSNEPFMTRLAKRSNVSTQPILSSSLYQIDGSMPTYLIKQDSVSQLDLEKSHPKSSMLFAGYQQQTPKSQEISSVERTVTTQQAGKTSLPSSNKPKKKKKHGLFARIFYSICCCFHSNTEELNNTRGAAIILNP